MKSRAERGLWIEDVPEPQVGIIDVKIRVLLAGICGMDLHIYEGMHGRRKRFACHLC